MEHFHQMSGVCKFLTLSESPEVPWNHNKMTLTYQRTHFLKWAPGVQQERCTQVWQLQTSGTDKLPLTPVSSLTDSAWLAPSHPLIINQPPCWVHLEKTHMLHQKKSRRDPLLFLLCCCIFWAKKWAIVSMFGSCLWCALRDNSKLCRYRRKGGCASIKHFVMHHTAIWKWDWSLETELFGNLA